MFKKDNNPGYLESQGAVSLIWAIQPVRRQPLGRQPAGPTLRLQKPDGMGHREIAQKRIDSHWPQLQTAQSCLAQELLASPPETHHGRSREDMPGSNLRGSTPVLSLGCHPCSLTIFLTRVPDMRDAGVAGCCCWPTPSIYIPRICGENRRQPVEVQQCTKLR